MAVVLADARLPDLPVVFANPAFQDLTGYHEAEILGRNCRFLQGPETDPRTVAMLKAAIETEDAIAVEILNYRKDGSKFWNALHLAPLYDDSGALQYFFGSQGDVTSNRAARTAEAHIAALTRELSHRVKNMCSIISAVVTMTAERHDALAISDQINERIFALGRTYEGAPSAAANGKVDLKALIQRALAPHLASGRLRMSLGGEDIDLRPSMSSTIGLILHELATDALSCGSLKSEGALVSLDARVIAGEHGKALRLVWTETGRPSTDPRRKADRKSSIMDSILEASDGTIERRWQQHGLVLSLVLPIQ